MIAAFAGALEAGARPLRKRRAGRAPDDWSEPR